MIARRLCKIGFSSASASGSVVASLARLSRRPTVSPMVYPSPFHRFVAIGSLYSDIFNFTLSIVPVPSTGTLDVGPVDDELLADVAARVSTWFSAATPTGAGIGPGAKLTSIKLNRIGPDGHYVDDSKEHIYPTPISPVGTGSAMPAQSAIAVTLRTAIPRGRGSRGRFFLPVPVLAQTVQSSDGRLTIAQATAQANGAKALVDSLNVAYASWQSGDSSRGRVGVASDIAGGRFAVATSIEVGRVIDTIRSRRSKLDEDRQEVAVA